ncbi:hypothetical protein Cflav_PD2636 [Pedosphaera parvula Ellin514]|uniref:Uncharacterized protein n=1 Tax=Pedosphaera parvula (strain Ellin514) TaxID=320771 RepID=B9XKH7_PEDPL|nr:hypothetical protein Cflav_PD2636 [Pedosphaera parvula Ellin514]
MPDDSEVNRRKRRKRSVFRALIQLCPSLAGRYSVCLESGEKNGSSPVLSLRSLCLLLFCCMVRICEWLTWVRRGKGELEHGLVS